MRSDSDNTDLNKARGLIFGLAIGDALGYPTEFMSLNQIKAEFGPDGMKDLSNDPALFTDDTQMSIAVAEARRPLHQPRQRPPPPGRRGSAPVSTCRRAGSSAPSAPSGMAGTRANRSCCGPVTATRCNWRGKTACEASPSPPSAPAFTAIRIGRRQPLRWSRCANIWPRSTRSSPAVSVRRMRPYIESYVRSARTDNFTR